MSEVPKVKAPKAKKSVAAPTSEISEAPVAAPVSAPVAAPVAAPEVVEQPTTSLKEIIEIMQTKSKNYTKKQLDKLNMDEIKNELGEMSSLIAKAQKQAKKELKPKRKVAEEGVRKNNTNTGIMKPHKISAEMIAFANEYGWNWSQDGEYSRIAIDKVINGYIKEFNLNPERKQLFAPDSKLATLLKYDAEKDGQFGYTAIKRLISRIIVA